VPLYEYECGKCGHRFERIQKHSDPHVKTCPKCKGKVKRLPSAPAIQFKGSGWYITDYARKGQSSGDEKTSDEKAKKTSEEKSTEEKSADEKPSKEKSADEKSDKDKKAASKATRKKSTSD